MKEEGDARDVRRQGERDGKQRKRTIWMHIDPDLSLCMGVAWLVGTVALALLTSAGQKTVEVLTEPEAHTHTHTAHASENACQDGP